MKSFSILLIKILALYLLLNILYPLFSIFLSGNVSYLLTSKMTVILLATIIPPIIGGCILWKYSECIASKIHKVEPETPIVNGREIVNSGLFLMGVYLLITHIGMLISDYMMTAQLDYGSLFIIFVSVLLICKNASFINLNTKHNNTQK